MSHHLSKKKFRPASCLGQQKFAIFLSLTLISLAVSTAPHAQMPPQANPASDYANWPILQPRFPSTGGGGVMIEGYDRILVANGKCSTDFQAVLPSGEIYRNEITFDAIPTAGGVLCANGKWRAKDGSSEGDTPFEVYIKDGMRRANLEFHLPLTSTTLASILPMCSSIMRKFFSFER